MMGIGVTAALVLTLRFLLKGRRSAPEVLVLGIGLCLPTLLYRGFTIVMAYINGINTGAGYGLSAALLVTFSYLLIASLAELPLTLLAAYFVNNGKTWLAVLLISILETFFLGAPAMAETLNLYKWIATLINCLLLGGCVWGAVQVWRRLPDPVILKKKIQWPDGEDDGHVA